MDEIQKQSEETTESETSLTTEEETLVGASEDSDTSKEELDTEFTDSERKETPKEKEPVQNNSENARRRRERERQLELKKARYDAIKEATSGINPFTNKAMEDEADIEEFLTMKEIEKSGKDPISDYAEFVKNKNRKEKQEKLENENREEWFKTDAESFIQKYPKVNLKELFDNESFKVFAKDSLGSVPLSQIYENYQNLVDTIRQKEIKERARLEANKKASPGSLTNSEGSENDLFSLEDVKKMSQEEVRQNYDKVMKSMKFWKY